MHVKNEICKRPRCLYLPHKSAALSSSFFVLQERKDRKLSRIDGFAFLTVHRLLGTETS
jgi:hypothetical protein